MAQNTVTMRMSKANKYMIENFVLENFKEKNPSIDNPSHNILITFLLQEYFKFFYPQLKSKSENATKL